MTSILAMIWLYRDTHDRDEIADLSWSILLVIVPSVAFFVVLPFALRSLEFWPAMLLASAVTAVSYGVWVWGARRLGVDL